MSFRSSSWWVTLSTYRSSSTFSVAAITQCASRTSPGHSSSAIEPEQLQAQSVTRKRRRRRRRRRRRSAVFRAQGGRAVQQVTAAAMAVRWLCDGCAMAVRWQCDGCAMAVQWLCVPPAQASVTSAQVGQAARSPWFLWCFLTQSSHSSPTVPMHASRTAWEQLPGSYDRNSVRTGLISGMQRAESSR